MRFIKRFIFIIILLVIAFFVYRLINPKAANSLLYDLTSFSNTTIGTHFSTGEKIIDTGAIFSMTGDILEETGTIIEETGALQKITGDDLLFFDDAESVQETVTPEILMTGTENTPILPPKTTTTPPKTTTSSNGSSSQALREAVSDLKNLFGN